MRKRRNIGVKKALRGRREEKGRDRLTGKGRM